MKVTLVISVFFAISYVTSAPIDSNTIYQLVKEDKRTEELQKNKYIRECKSNSENSKSICFALYDLALTFNSKNQNFTANNSSYESGTFCDELTKVVPDAPGKESSALFGQNTTWFKAVLSNKETGKESCQRACFYIDPNTYEENLLRPVCQFLLNQFSFLASPPLEAPKRESR